MEVRVQCNWNRKTNEDLFGLSIRLDDGRLYCKFPIGHQGYKTYTEAKEALIKVKEQLQKGFHLEYGAKGSAGINKTEYVRIAE